MGGEEGVSPTTEHSTQPQVISIERAQDWVVSGAGLQARSHREHLSNEAGGGSPRVGGLVEARPLRSGPREQLVSAPTATATLSSKKVAGPRDTRRYAPAVAVALCVATVLWWNFRAVAPSVQEQRKGFRYKSQLIAARSATALYGHSSASEIADSPSHRLAIRFMARKKESYQCPVLNTTRPVIPPELQSATRNEWGYPRRQRRYSWEQFPKIVRGEGFQFTLCTIPKNGCSQWKRMILKAMRFPPEFYLDEVTSHLTVHGTKYKYLPYAPKSKLLAALAAPHAVISRNPFTRVLSAYLNKIVKATERRRYRRKLGLDEWSDYVTFEEYVHALKKWADREPNGLKLSSGIDHHWALQTSFCGLPNDDTSSLHHDWVLKMEDVNDWYTCFVNKMNITHIVESGWPGNKCFFSAPDKPCDGQRLEDAGYTKTKWDAVGHKTRSSSKAEQFYTEELERLVVELYDPDFEFFGYPKSLNLPKTVTVGG